MRRGLLVPTWGMFWAVIVGFILSLLYGQIILATFLHYLAAGITNIAYFLERTLFLIGIPALILLILVCWKWQIAFAFVIGSALALLLIIVGIDPLDYIKSGVVQCGNIVI